MSRGVRDDIEKLRAREKGREVERINLGDDMDGAGPVTIQHEPRMGEVHIRVGGFVVAAVDASEFFTALEKVK